MVAKKYANVVGMILYRQLQVACLVEFNIVRTPFGPEDGPHHATGFGDCQEVNACATSPRSTHVPGFIALFCTHFYSSQTKVSV